MSRNVSRAQRLREFEGLLEARARSVVELAKHFGVSRRTIERDLLDLGAYRTVEGKDHRYRIPVPPTDLNNVEALAVHSATRLLVHTGVGERHYRSALEKLSKRLPEPARSELLKSVDMLETSGDDRVLDQVAQAWFQGRVLCCEYRSGKGRNWHPHEYEIYFYELNRRNLQPYVVAFEKSYFCEVRVFKLARMRNVRLLADTYSIPEDFDPHEFLSGTWGIVVGEPVEVRLRVEPSVAGWFQEQREHDENVSVVQEFDDGGLEVVIRGRLAEGGDAHELLSFLLGWGHNVEVLEPESVRERVARDLGVAAERYR
ncbi:MAG: WYL domain-containing protein [Trueperaceae bacterium]